VGTFVSHARNKRDADGKRYPEFHDMFDEPYQFKKKNTASVGRLPTMIKTKTKEKKMALSKHHDQ